MKEYPLTDQTKIAFDEQSPIKKADKKNYFVHLRGEKTFSISADNCAK